MRQIVFLLILMSVPGVSAREPLTMDDCIRYAVSHSTQVRKSRLEADNARIGEQAAFGAFLPTVSAGVSGQYSWGRNVDPETNTYNTVTTFNSYYQLYTSLQVFDGGRTLNLFRQARVQRQQGMNNVQRAVDDLAIDVMRKFVEAAYACECVRLAEARLDDSRLLLAKTRRMEELGVKGYPDVAQIEAQVAEDDYNLTRQRNQSDAALLALKSAMNYPQGDSLAVSVSDPVFSGDTGNLCVSSLNPAHPRAVAAELSVRQAHYLYLVEKGSLLPSLSVSAGVATNYFRNVTSGVTVTPFHSQFWNNMGEHVAVSLSVPLFNYSAWRNVRKARNQLERTRLERDEAVRQLQDDMAQAVMDLQGCEKEMELLDRKVASDSVAYRLSVRKFEEGMLSTFDLHTAANQLLDARIRRLQTRMTYVMRQKLVAYYKGEKWIG